MTKEELLSSKGHSMKMKDLRKFVEKYKDIDDEAPVVVERVEDHYFEKVGGWDVLEIEGYHYHSSVEWNKKMQREIERRKRGEEPEYDMEDPSLWIFAEEKIESMKEQFYQPHCITTDKEKQIVYIYSHY